MGGCCSPWFADIAIELLEENSLEKLKSSNALNSNYNFFSNPPIFYDDKIIFFKRFVDDILIIAKKTEINNILETFNNYHPSLQFTLKKESNNKISFLDIEINRI